MGREIFWMHRGVGDQTGDLYDHCRRTGARETGEKGRDGKKDSVITRPHALNANGSHARNGKTRMEWESVRRRQSASVNAKGPTQRTYHSSRDEGPS